MKWNFAWDVPGVALPGTTNGFLAILSLVLAIIGAYTALQFMEALVLRMRSSLKSGASVGNFALFALISASFSIGVNSVWVMHFIATSSVTHGKHSAVRYNLGETILSLIFIFLGAFAGMVLVASHRDGVMGDPRSSRYYVLLRQAPGAGATLKQHIVYHLRQLRAFLSWRLIVGGALFGVGVGAMHFSGVAAIRSNVTLYLDPVWVLTAVPVAWIAGCAGLFLLFHMHGFHLRIIGSIILGAAVTSVHWYAYQAGSYVALPLSEWSPDMYAGEVLVEARSAVVVTTLISSVARFMFLGIISAGEGG